jgi:hypothetical protein
MMQPGLKDHQIAQLVNAVRDEVKVLVPHQCLRQVIADAVVRYLEEAGLRIDSPNRQKGEQGS